MKYTLQDNQDNPLLEAEITFHLPAWRRLLLGYGGILPRFGDLLWYAFWLWFCSGWQCVWADSFPMLGFYPLALFVAFWSARHSLVGGLVACLIGGFLLDAGMFLPLGSQALTLLPVAWLAVWLEERLPSWKFTVLAPIVQGFSASLLFGLCFLIFCGGDSDILFRLRQFARHLLPAALFSGLLGAPLLFALWGLLPLGRRQK